jgi:predicted peroxiredoxin
LSDSRLAILLWSVSADRPDLAAAPFVYAAAAAALDAEVEVHFGGRSVRLLVKGVAADLRASEWSGETVYGLMKQAAANGARFVACSTAARAYVVEGESLIAEYSGSSGAAAFAQRALDPAWRTLVF